MEALGVLLETRDLWLPSLGWLAGHIAATTPGRRADAALKARLSWLADPAARRAFADAWESGLRSFADAEGDTEAGGDALGVLVALTGNEGDEGDDARARLAGELFRPVSTPQLLEEVVGESGAVPGRQRQQRATAALERLVRDHMRQAFLAESYFTQRVAAAQIIGLLEQAVDARARTREYLDAQEADYRFREAHEARLISTHGISPMVGDRQLGLPMDEVFVPLVLGSAREDVLRWALGQMSHRERRVLELRFGIESAPSGVATPAPPGRAATLEEVGRVFNITRGRIRQIESQAIKKLDSLLQAQILRDDRLPLSHAVAAGFSAGDLLSGRAPGVELRHGLSYPRVVVQGDPGSGKSTLLQYVLWALCSGRSIGLPWELERYLPLRLRAAEYARALADRMVTLEEYLIESAGRFAEAAERAMLGGRALVLMDGLDEVADPLLRGRVMTGLNHWLSDPLYTANRAVITTRIVGYVPQGPLSELPHLTLTELSDSQIERFARGWYGVIAREFPLDVESETTELVRQLRADAQVRELAGNPLLLTILALLRRRGGRLPNQRARLYSSALDTLVHTWPLGPARSGD